MASTPPERTESTPYMMPTQFPPVAGATVVDLLPGLSFQTLRGWRASAALGLALERRPRATISWEALG